MPATPIPLLLADQKIRSGSFTCGFAQNTDKHVGYDAELVHELLASAHEMPAPMEEIYKKLAKYYGMLSDMKQRPHSIAEIKSIQVCTFTGCSSFPSLCYLLVYRGERKF
jgi:hypothetical protein